MTEPTSSTQPAAPHDAPLATVQRFLKHVFEGDLPAALALVAPDARFVAARETPLASVPLYGLYRGPEGAGEMFSRFAQTLKPGDFRVDQAFEQGDSVVMHGAMRHTAIATGRPFASDWVLVAKVEQGRLRAYHFHEDTAALQEALAA